jgi:hypothetical protein
MSAGVNGEGTVSADRVRQSGRLVAVQSCLKRSSSDYTYLSNSLSTDPEDAKLFIARSSLKDDLVEARRGQFFRSSARVLHL